MDEDQENQGNELLALSSIFEDEETFMAHEDKSGGSFYADVELPSIFEIKLGGQMIQQARTLGALIHGEDDEENPARFMPVNWLPPIELNFKYPRDYPSKTAPTFTLSCKWLSVKQLNRLCEKLDEIWTENEGEVVVFSWAEFLKNATFPFLKLSSPLTLDTSDLPRTLRMRSTQPGPGGDDGGNHQGATGGVARSDAGVAHDRAVQDIAALPNLIPTIVQYDHERREHAFNTSPNSCEVCYEEKFGTDCVKFSPCGHVYCKGCMKEHFRTKIKDGDVKGLACPETNCETMAQPGQVRELVEPELFEKYDKALLDLSLSEMGDIVYCPRVICQTPVVREGNMGQCAACRLAFCILCKNTYHGLAPCKVTSERYKEIMDDYDNATDDERALMEQRYGKHTLRQVIENCNSEAWINKHSKKCPNCQRPIQKSDGCNKMTCRKCRCYFCWLCHAILPRSDPYSHYRNTGSCANRLFQGMDGEEDEEGDDVPVDVVNIENWWEFV
nr:E3 ubiquitin-protein ligase RNF14-like [Lytechinus pictus]XP_054755135.1 E3 ubiquitin-protein ligase RNF14-like [Lytechinus pictus]